MKLIEKQWGGYKGKYKNHQVEIISARHANHNYQFIINRNERHVFSSVSLQLYFETKEEARDAAIIKIDELTS
ncbi:hypothetical protein [Paenibacillus odorifer]|uniref:hypothetical protein n=1 Tax=Paenibacillus odorifer TaxID=189426 RepID=UPI00096F71B0|nr:hypothetical protein [Paenibacillus odorifer]OMD66198.1 hypothetical protein BSK50_30795 [Paenibacillus odorifer]